MPSLRRRHQLFGPAASETPGSARGTGSLGAAPCGSAPSTGWRSAPESSGGSFSSAGVSGEACVARACAGTGSAPVAVVKSGVPSERDAAGSARRLWRLRGLAPDEAVPEAGFSLHLAHRSAASRSRPSCPAITASRSSPAGTGARKRTSVKPSVRPTPWLSVSTHSPRADLGRKVPRERRCAPVAQAPRPLLHDLAGDLRHARRGRAGPGREREDVEMGQAAFVDEIERAGEHRLGLGREAGDDVGAEHHVRPQPPDLVAEPDRIGARDGAASCA